MNLTLPPRVTDRAFARLAGHELLREEEQGGVFRYWLRKA